MRMVKQSLTCHCIPSPQTPEMAGLIPISWMVEYTYGFGSKPYSPVVHIKIAGIYGCELPTNIDNNRFWHTSIWWRFLHGVWPKSACPSCPSWPGRAPFLFQGDAVGSRPTQWPEGCVPGRCWTLLDVHQMLLRRGNHSWYPMVMTNIANWKIPIFTGKIHCFYGHMQ